MCTRLGVGLAVGEARIHDRAVRGPRLGVQREQLRAVVRGAQARDGCLQAPRALQLHRVAPRRVPLECCQRAARAPKLPCAGAYLANALFQRARRRVCPGGKLCDVRPERMLVECGWYDLEVSGCAGARYANR